jgi:N-acetylglutamate synthase-like GNAT family acetyltransferase
MPDIEIVADWDVRGHALVELQGLLRTCFPGFLAERTYYKQLPHTCLLARTEGRLIGQVGIDDRVMRIDDRPSRVFGLVDLCVTPGARGMGCGRALIRGVEKLAHNADIDTLVALADRPEIYSAAGFATCDVDATWLAIHELRSVSLLNRRLDGVFQVRFLRRDLELPRRVDFLGHMF